LADDSQVPALICVVRGCDSPLIFGRKIVGGRMLRVEQGPTLQMTGVDRNAIGDCLVAPAAQIGGKRGIYMKIVSAP
jgi:hypothetical protein